MYHSINLITSSYYHRNDYTDEKASVVSVLLKQTIQSANSRRRFLTHVNANTLLKPEKDILANESKTNDVSRNYPQSNICLFAVIKTLSRIALFILSSLRGVFRRRKFTEALVHVDIIAYVFHRFICKNLMNRNFENYIEINYFKYLFENQIFKIIAEIAYQKKVLFFICHYKYNTIAHKIIKTNLKFFSDISGNIRD